MNSKIKVFCAILLIVSMLGLSVINLTDGDWKSFCLGILYSIANVIIFIV